MKVTLQDTTGTISWFGQGPLSGRWLTGLLLVTVGCVLHVNAQPYGDMLMMASCCSIAVFTNAIWCIFYLKEKFTLSIDLISSLLICVCGGLVAIQVQKAEKKELSPEQLKDLLMRPGSIIIFSVCLLVIICGILSYFRLKSLM